jgi:hypothetical protein
MIDLTIIMNERGEEIKKKIVDVFGEIIELERTIMLEITHVGELKALDWYDLARRNTLLQEVVDRLGKMGCLPKGAEELIDEGINRIKKVCDERTCGGYNENK